MPQEADALTQVKREQSLSDRPGKTAPIPRPAGLGPGPDLLERHAGLPAPPSDHQFSKVPYKAAAPKGEMSRSLDYNQQQRKVAEDATK
jgi:hypothetical protein